MQFQCHEEHDGSKTNSVILSKEGSKCILLPPSVSPSSFGLQRRNRQLLGRSRGKQKNGDCFIRGTSHVTGLSRSGSMLMSWYGWWNQLDNKLNPELPLNHRLQWRQHLVPNSRQILSINVWHQFLFFFVYGSYFFFFSFSVAQAQLPHKKATWKAISMKALEFCSLQCWQWAFRGLLLIRALTKSKC